MQPSLLYIACVASSIALYLLLRPGKQGLRVVAALAGLGAFAGLLVGLVLAIGEDHAKPPLFFSVFALIAVASATKMITHSRPVYSALYFILVVLASAALFLMMEAEFMAFALVIVYAGAILVTYLFVIMLAQQAEDPESTEEAPAYDRLAREPAAATTVGFIMLALLCSLIFSLAEDPPARVTEQQGHAAAWAELEQMPVQLRQTVADAADTEEFELGWGDGQPVLQPSESGQSAVARIIDADGTRREIELAPTDAPQNVQRVGWALVAEFPVSLELAGIILLMAMFGAVVLARRQIEIGEDELRRAAGMGGYAQDAMDDTELPEGGGA